VELHPLAARFAAVADRYERGRPDYPPAVVGALTGELGLAPGARVLDLAAGTGKLTRALLAAGLDVVAVEPQPELRALLSAGDGGADVRPGRAEAIPLEAGTVDAVTVADAFHWFEPAGALAEMRRVLRGRGGLAVLTTIPDWGGVSWGHEVGSLMMEMRPSHPHFDGPSWQQAVREAGGWEEPREVRVTSMQPTDPDRLVDHIASFSWVAALPDDEREGVLARVRGLITAEETPAELPVRVVIGLTRTL